MSTTTPYMSTTQLGAVASVATVPQIMREIQSLIDEYWDIDYPLGNNWFIKGSPNDFSISFNLSFNYSGTIIPAVPAYTVTPAIVVPPVMTPAIPAVPGWGTTNPCSIYGGKCTYSIPGTPAVPATTITPGYTIPAVLTPAVPALTGGYSSTVVVNTEVQGTSAAVNELLESLTFAGLSRTGNAQAGDITESISYNVKGMLNGLKIRVNGYAAINDIRVDIGGVVTNLGDISTGTIPLNPVPDIPLKANLIIAVPPYNKAPAQFPATASTVAYTFNPLPNSNRMSVDQLAISTGATPISDFIISLLNPLTTSWNQLVCPVFSAAGASCPPAPTQTLANNISKNAVSTQTLINTSTQTELNKLLADNLDSLKPYVEPIIATGWNVAVYTPNGPNV